MAGRYKLTVSHQHGLVCRSTFDTPHALRRDVQRQSRRRAGEPAPVRPMSVALGHAGGSRGSGSKVGTMLVAASADKHPTDSRKDLSKVPRIISLRVPD